MPHLKKDFFIITILCFLLSIFLTRNTTKSYYPKADEFTLIVDSTPYGNSLNIKDWFTVGWSKYLTIYPEYPAKGSDFLRPVVNALYYINYLLWGENWSKHLFANFLIIAIGCSVGFYITRKFFGSSRPFSYLTALCLLLNPAVTEGYTTQYGVVDNLSALLAALAFVFTMDNRIILVMIFLILGTFTKEITLFAPVAAAITIFLMKYYKGMLRIRSLIACFLVAAIPLGLWETARYLAFRGNARAYVLNTLNIINLFKRFIISMMKWPLGLEGDITEPIGLIKAVIFHQWDLISPLKLIVVFANLAAIMAAIYFSVKIILNYKNEKNKKFMYILPWIYGIYLMVVVLVLPVRNGFSLYILGYPVLIYALSRSVKNKNFIAASFVIVILTVTLIPTAAFFYRANNQLWVNDFKHGNDLSRSLIDKISKCGQEYEKIYVVNDMSAHYGNRLLASFAQVDIPVVTLSGLEARLDDLTWCVKGHAHTQIEELEGGKCVITIQISEGAGFFFHGMPPMGKRFYRNENITYEFPEYKSPTKGLFGGEHQHKGDVLKIYISNSSNYAIIYYDSKNDDFLIKGFH